MEEEEIDWESAISRLIIESHILPKETPYWKVVQLAISILKYQRDQTEGKQ